MDLIQKYFSELSEKQKDQFNQMGDLYREWNNSINLISRKDLDNLYERHILHSLAIAKIISFKPGTSIMDAGTGGGFPGIPLAIIFHDSKFHLVDSTMKKLKAVEAISTSLGLENITTQHIRLEDLKDNFDFVVSRAVTSLPEIWEFTRKNINTHSVNDLPNGVIYLKGGDISQEIKDTPARILEYDIQEFFTQSFFETKKVIHLSAN